jgi:hypothetical protein
VRSQHPDRLANYFSLTKPSAWLRGKDLNLRPSGYEPDELPDCSTPRLIVLFTTQTRLDLNQRPRQSQSTRLFSEVQNYAREFLCAQAQRLVLDGFCCSSFKRNLARSPVKPDFRNIFKNSLNFFEQRFFVVLHEENQLFC